ncbi:hypothetical protein [Teredinibacter haidensis]|uniref:hypothetical protein n=1 Tax=Teredinibacter haidensis TaxID=2731755 RepID=UPI001FEC8BDA|nr:hypothetical protein [Teredinibacter haidensis]
MRVQFNGLSPLAACLFGLLSGIALVVMLAVPRLHQINNTHSQHYGNALATMAANQAIDASFNHDLVRLQVILRDVMDNPGTLLATIHDVENNLLVQAGDARTLDNTAQTYTAPIILHDSIAGYLSVSLKQTHAVGGGATWLLATLTAALLLILLLELYRQRSFTIQNHSPPHADPEQEQEEEDDIIETLDDIETLPKVYAIIHIKNLTVLKQQLNGENFRKTLGGLEQTISDVLALYNGSSYQLEGDLFRLTFIANDATNEALFRAACSAWLIVELASITHKIPLDLAAFVSANNLDLAPANLPIAGLVLESHAANDDLIRRRLRFVEVGALDGRKVVAGFEQPFQSLLEKQRLQLNQL